jgi:hypothetical protein
MSKMDLKAIVESCVYMDPFAHVYYAAHKREAAHRVGSEQGEADAQESLRLIKRWSIPENGLSKRSLRRRSIWQ